METIAVLRGVNRNTALALGLDGDLVSVVFDFENRLDALDISNHTERRNVRGKTLQGYPEFVLAQRYGLKQKGAVGVTDG